MSVVKCTRWECDGINCGSIAPVGAKDDVPVGWISIVVERVNPGGYTPANGGALAFCPMCVAKLYAVIPGLLVAPEEPGT